MRNILTEKRQWCKVEIGKKTEKYAQTASESLFEKRYIVYKITLHAAGAGGEGDCSFTKRQTDEMWEEFPVGIAIRQEIFGLFFCRVFPFADSGKYVGITNKRSRFLCNIYRQRC